MGQRVDAALRSGVGFGSGLALQVACRAEVDDAAVAVIAVLLAVEVAAEAGDREALMPLLGLPPEPEDGDARTDAADALDGIPADFPFAAAWAAGFLRGAARFEDAWTTWMDDHPAIDNDLGVITRLAIVDAAQLDAAEMSAEAMLTLDERFDLTDDLPDMLYDMYLQRLHDRRPAPARRADVPGRNDPCVCGSGKKYKKCCADTASA